MSLLFIFLIGTLFGSFLNVLIDRFPRSESVLKGRSRCESCNKVLAPIDLVPIVSYITLSGRCRYCHAKIPIRLPIVEAASGAIAVFLFVYTVNILSPILSVLLFIIILCFLGIFFADLIYGIIPDEFVVAIIFSTFVFLFISKPGLIPQHFLVGTASFLVFLLIYSVTRGRGMGFGDVKLAGAIGFFLGFPNIIVGVYTAFLTALFISMILILTGRKKFRGGTIAFGPYLSAGATVGYFLGTRILDLFL